MACVTAITPVESLAIVTRWTPVPEAPLPIVTATPFIWAQLTDWFAAKEESLDSVTLGMPAPPAPVPVTTTEPPNCATLKGSLSGKVPMFTVPDTGCVAPDPSTCRAPAPVTRATSVPSWILTRPTIRVSSSERSTGTAEALSWASVKPSVKPAPMFTSKRPPTRAAGSLSLIASSRLISVS